MDKAQRECLEWRSKVYNAMTVAHGNNDIPSRIEQDRPVVEEYNETCSENDQIRLVVTIKRTAARLHG